MFTLMGAILDIVVFASLSLMQQQQAMSNIQNAQFASIEMQSAAQMNAFATAAYAYAKSQGLTAGNTVNAATLTAAAFLPGNFNDKNQFNQTLLALVGNGYASGIGLAVYYTNAPSDLLGLTNNTFNQSAIAMQTALRLATIQHTTPGFASGVLTGANYSSYKLPYTLSNSLMTTNFPGFTLGFPSTVNLINVLPNTNT